MALDGNEILIMGVSGYTQIPYGSFLKSTTIEGKINFSSNTQVFSAESITTEFSASSNTPEYSFET